LKDSTNKTLITLDTGKPGRRFLRLHAFSFLEDTEPERASFLYDRDQDYAIRATIIRTGREKWQDLSLGECSHELNEVQAFHQPALYWMGQCWGSWLMQNLDSVDAFADISRVEKLMNKVHDLNLLFHYAGPHLFLGAFYGGRSKMLGGSPKKWVPILKAFMKRKVMCF
jgi:hypothetical protein